MVSMKLMFKGRFHTYLNTMYIANRRRCYLILSTIIPVLVITALFANHFLSTPLSSSDTIRITNVQKTVQFTWNSMHHWIPLINDQMIVWYYNVRFVVGVENSKASDASNLGLVVRLELNNFTVESTSKTIEILAGEAKSVLINLNGVPDVYIFNRWNYENGPLFIVTLHSDKEVLDEQVITQ
ncbi:MAG: hypothetical protein OEY22_10740 [Candidatus Bathyarchaeota archaeon]|nr:hypothetical protein [Candidatus Bathyarchaeota archaeon]MDH5787329.1 hypothetical protein [Candidatus Bathyarchaeota archaeon]